MGHWGEGGGGSTPVYNLYKERNEIKRNRRMTVCMSRLGHSCIENERNENKSNRRMAVCLFQLGPMQLY